MRNFTRTRDALALAAAAAALPSAVAFADPETEQLRAQLQQLEQKLLVLERREEIRSETAAASRPPVVVATASGFAFSDADRRYQLRLRANLHADARFFISDNVEGNDTFLLRRLRPTFEGVLAEKFAFRIMPDLAPSNFSLLDAYATYQHSRAFNLLVGKTKSPFDLERLASELLFIERGFPTTLGPNRDLGVQVFGEVLGGTLGYQFAWLNGARDNDSTVTDTDDAKEVVGRLFTHPFANVIGSPLQGLGFGVAYSYGDKHTGSPNSYRTNAQQTFFAWRSTVLSHGRHTRFEPQGYYYFGPVGLIGSWASSKHELWNGPGTATQQIENTAWFAAAHWVLTGEETSFRGVTPRDAFNPSAGTWGAWELAVRYGELEIDDNAFPVFANPATAARRARGTTLGLNWYLNRNVKAVLNFEHTSFDGGPTGTVTREDEKAILTRVQLRY